MVGGQEDEPGLGAPPAESKHKTQKGPNVGGAQPPHVQIMDEDAEAKQEFTPSMFGTDDDPWTLSAAKML